MSKCVYEMVGMLINEQDVSQDCVEGTKHYFMSLKLYLIIRYERNIRKIIIIIHVYKSCSDMGCQKLSIADLSSFNVGYNSNLH